MVFEDIPGVSAWVPYCLEEAFRYLAGLPKSMAPLEVLVDKST